MSEAEVVPLRGPGRPPKQTVEEVAAELNEMVDQLIAENRQLRRRLAQMLEATSESDHDGGRAALRRLHRKVTQALS